LAFSELERRLRAELAQELGFRPATVDPADIAGLASVKSRLPGAQPWRTCTSSSERPMSDRQRGEVKANANERNVER
jgi:hypothetical protein